MQVRLHPVAELNTNQHLWIVDSENDPLQLENIETGKWDGFALITEENHLKGFILLSQLVDTDDLDSYAWMHYDELEAEHHPRVMFLGKDCPADLAEQVRTGTISQLTAREAVVRNKDGVIFKFPPSEFALQVCYGGPSFKITGIRGLCTQEAENED